MKGTITTSICLLCNHYEVCKCNNPYRLPVVVDLDEFKQYMNSRTDVQEEASDSFFGAYPETPLLRTITHRRQREKTLNEHFSVREDN